MRGTGWRAVIGVAVMVAVAGGTAVFARQQAAGSIVPGKFFVVNKTREEAVPVSLIGVDHNTPLPVLVMGSTDVELGQRTIQQLVPKRPTWEYSVLPVTEAEMQARLTAVGRDGWELVNVLPGAKTQTLVMKRAR